MPKRAATRKIGKPATPALKPARVVPEETPHDRQLKVVTVTVILVAVIFCLYWPVRRYGFVNFDDDLYVTLNSQVRAGLTWEGLKWAFTSVDLVYWQPLTWLSLMLDSQFFGMDAGQRHLVSVVIHAANSVLLLFVLQYLTKRFWPSVFVAGLFALHPLRVESVVWIAERKDVLCAFFWLLTIWLYARHAKKETLINYLWMAAAFAGGLMAKPMLVSLPLIFLLLDYWPLRRNGIKKLVIEKLPLFAMAIAAALVTMRGQLAMGAVAPLPLATRVANAISSSVIYLGELLWPHNLTVMYPYRANLSAAWIGFCLLLLAGITGATIVYRKRHAYLFTGWFWYILAVGPTLGIVQVGPQAYADRFTYLPCIGLLIGIVWLAADVSVALPNRRVIAATLGAVLFSVLIWRTAMQLPVWENSVTLFTRAAEVFPDNAINQHNLGFALAEMGQFDAAIPHYQAALREDSTQYKADYNLGRALAQQGRLAEAITHFQNALKSPLQPMYESDVRNGMGIALAREQKLTEAQTQFERAIALRPDSAELHANLAACLASQHQVDKAVAEFQKAIALNPASLQAHRNLAHAWLDIGRKEDAKREYQILLQLAPGNEEARQQLEVLAHP